MTDIKISNIKALTLISGDFSSFISLEIVSVLWLNLKHTFHKYETHQVNFEGASLTKNTNRKWQVESDSSYL